MEKTQKIEKIQRRERFCMSAPQVRSTQQDDSEVVEITGRAIVFNRESVTLYEDEEREIREVIAPEAVTDDLLARSTILMTLYHNKERVLARSLKGKGTLRYKRTDEGVDFSFTPPDTEDGRTARELVARGDITGCSFAFRADYGDREAVERSVETVDGREIVTFTVKRMLGVYDFTLTPMPAYEDTSVSTRMAAVDTMLRERMECASRDKRAALRTEAARLRRIADSEF